MTEYLELLRQSFANNADYLWRSITHPDHHSFVAWLVGISVVVYALELMAPWRREQPRVRRDFWLDAFYMVFNLFLFPLLGYAAVATLTAHLFEDLLAQFGLTNLVAVNLRSWPAWLQLLSLFVIRDFVQWNIHRLLHRSEFLWRFHQVHHSVRQMGFAAHLRFHWMETLVYSILQYVPLAMLGFGVTDFTVVYVATLAIGHLNHANLYLPIGPLRYVLNTPQMHIWHHGKQALEAHPHGVNFGLTLSVWDWLFGTAHWPGHPADGRDIELGFESVEAFPRSFIRQLLHGWRRERGTDAR